MTKNEALKMAIEAMRSPNNLSFLMAITACKEALDQPAQEPVAWMDDLDEGEVMPHAVKMKLGCSQYSIPLYTHPAPQPAQGEIVVTKNDTGQIVMVSRQDSEGNILSVIAESENT